MQDFTKLRVWRSAHRLRLAVYKVTQTFPADERFGLTSQLRRSSSSIPANIAESCGYRGGAVSARFLSIALGSRSETLDHLIVARDLQYLSRDAFLPLERELDGIRRMLVSLSKRMTSVVKRQTPNVKQPFDV